VNTTPETTLEQIVAECSQDDSVIGIVTYDDAPRVTRVVCYTAGISLISARNPLRYVEGKLIQIEKRKLGAEDADVVLPTVALRMIPEWRMAEIRYDPDGTLAERKAQADAFQWDDNLQTAANHYASQRLYGLAPLMQSVMHAVRKDDWSLLSLDSGEIGRALGEAMLVQSGVMKSTQGEMYRALQHLMGEDSPWWREFSQAVGLRLPTGWISLARMRGLAALALYLETLKLFTEILDDSHRGVIEITAKQIEETVGEYRK